MSATKKVSVCIPAGMVWQGRPGIDEQAPVAAVRRIGGVVSTSTEMSTELPMKVSVLQNFAWAVPPPPPPPPSAGEPPSTETVGDRSAAAPSGPPPGAPSPAGLPVLLLQAASEPAAAIRIQARVR